MGLKDGFEGVKKLFKRRESEEQLKEENEVVNKPATAAGGKRQISSSSLARRDTDALVNRIAENPSLFYENFERALMANEEVQLYLDYPLYEVYSSAFSKLCRPLLKFVGFSHYGGSLEDDAWESALKGALEDVKELLAQDLPQEGDGRNKLEWKFRLDLSQECVFFLLDFIACSNCRNYGYWELEKRERLNELMYPNAKHHFKEWRTHLKRQDRMQDRKYSGEKMKDAYRWLRDKAGPLARVQLRPELYKEYEEKFEQYGKLLEEDLREKEENTGLRLGFYEEEARRKSATLLDFRDSKIKCPGLFEKDSEAARAQGEYPSASDREE